MLPYKLINRQGRQRPLHVDCRLRHVDPDDGLPEVIPSLVNHKSVPYWDGAGGRPEYCFRIQDLEGILRQIYKPTVKTASDARSAGGLGLVRGTGPKLRKFTGT